MLRSDATSTTCALGQKRTSAGEGAKSRLMRYPTELFLFYENLYSSPLRPPSLIHITGRQDAQKLSGHYIPSHFSKSISKQSIGVQAGVRQAWHIIQAGKPQNSLQNERYRQLAGLAYSLFMSKVFPRPGKNQRKYVPRALFFPPHIWIER